MHLLIAPVAAFFAKQVTESSYLQDIFYAVATICLLLVVGAVGFIDAGLVRRKNLLDTWVQKLVCAFLAGLGMIVIGYAFWEAQFYQAFAIPHPIGQALHDWSIFGPAQLHFSQNLNPTDFPTADVFQIFVVFFAAYAAVGGALLHSAGLERVKALPMYIISLVAGAVVIPIRALLHLGLDEPADQPRRPRLHRFLLAVRRRRGVGAHPRLASRSAPRGLRGRQAHDRSGPAQPGLERGRREHPDLRRPVCVPGLRLHRAGRRVSGDLAHRFRHRARDDQPSSSPTSEGVWPARPSPTGRGIRSWCWSAPPRATSAPGRASTSAIRGRSSSSRSSARSSSTASTCLLFKLKIDDKKIVPLALGGGIYSVVAAGIVGAGHHTGGYYGLTGKYAPYHAVITEGWQLIGLAVTLAIAAISGLVLIIGLEKTIGLRVSEEAEINGPRRALLGSPSVALRRRARVAGRTQRQRRRRGRANPLAPPDAPAAQTPGGPLPWGPSGAGCG